MTKALYLIRHAKSSWAEPNQKDFDRPLNARGKRSIPIVGIWIKQQSFSNPVMLCSAAKRTQQTKDGLLKYLPGQLLVETRESLYAASFKSICDQVSALPNAHHSALVIAHNPGLTDCVNYLTDEGIDNIPTLGVAKISFENENWEEIFGGTGHLESFVYPKSLNPESFK